MSRPISPRVLITLGWVLLLPVAAFVLLRNGFVRQAWDDTRYEKRIHAIVAATEPEKEILDLAARLRAGTADSMQRAEYDRRVHALAARCRRSVADLRALRVAPKDRAWQAGVETLLVARAQDFGELAAALDSGDPAEVLAARKRAEARAAARELAGH